MDNGSHRDDGTSSEERNDLERLWQPSVLVLGPGGVKGFLELGALLYLHNEGLLDRVRTIVGCSIGAIIGLLLVAGYQPNDIIRTGLKTDLFQDITSISFEDIQQNAGIISNRAVEKTLSKLLRRKFGLVPNLKQLYLATGYTYVATTFNLDRNRTEYISKDTEPNLSSVSAALLSMNIPFIFYRLTYRNCVYIDGAFGNPYPIDLYDDGSTDILGVNITSRHPSLPDRVEDSLLKYAYRVIHCSMDQIKLRIEQGCSDRCKHLTLVSPTLDTAGLTLARKNKLELVKQGYQSGVEFVDRLHHPERYTILNFDESSTSSEDATNTTESYSSDEELDL